MYHESQPEIQELDFNEAVTDVVGDDVTPEHNFSQEEWDALMAQMRLNLPSQFQNPGLRFSRHRFARIERAKAKRKKAKAKRK